MKVLGIDPGSTESACVFYDAEQQCPLWWHKLPNLDILNGLDHLEADAVAIEMVASYGMAVGAEVFETCVWAGRFIERWLVDHFCRPDPMRLYRRDVKLHLCGSQQAKDSNIRQALIDRYGPGKDKAVGKKASPGPLYGMKADCWQALAVAITAVETKLERAA